MKKLLAVIDMQNDFVTGSLSSSDASSIIPAVRSKIKQELELGTDIVFTKDTHDEDYLSTEEGKNLPVIHCIQGQWGWDIIPELTDLAAGRPIFEKNTFGSLDLARYALDNSYDEIELAGLCTDICVISNAMLLKAFIPSASISVGASCCAGVTPESHSNALEAMKMCHIKIN